MKDDLAPLSAELQSLLEGERQRPGAPAAAKASVSAELAILVGGRGLSHATATRPADPQDSTAGHGSSAAPNSAVQSAAQSAAGLAWHYVVPALAAALVLGGAMGVWLAPRLRPLPASAPSLPQAKAPLSKAPEIPTPQHVEEPPVAPARENERPHHKLGASAAHGTNGAPRPSPDAAQAAVSSNAARSRFAAERLLIDAARSALARGDGSAALKALSQHQQEFPAGALAEERDALNVQSLAAIGRMNEAGEQAGRFRKRYPTSLLLPIVDRAVGANQ